MDYQQKRMIVIGQMLQAYTDEEKPGPWVVAYSGGKDSTVALDRRSVWGKNRLHYLPGYQNR